MSLTQVMIKASKICYDKITNICQLVDTDRNLKYFLILKSGVEMSDVNFIALGFCSV